MGIPFDDFKELAAGQTPVRRWASPRTSPV